VLICPSRIVSDKQANKSISYKMLNIQELRESDKANKTNFKWQSAWLEYEQLFLKPNQ